MNSQNTTSRLNKELHEVVIAVTVTVSFE